MRNFFAILIAVFCLAQPALAQDKSLAQDQSLERLVTTLESQPDREALVRDLKALMAARKPPAENQGVLARVTDHVGQVGDDVLDAVSALKLAPKLVDWAALQAGDPVARARWVDILMRLGAVLLAGWLAEQALSFALARTRRNTAPPERVTWAVRGALAFVRASIDLMPVAAFAGAGWGIVTLLGLGGNLRVAAVTVISAYVGVRLVLVIARLLVAPRTPSLRLLAVSDETAEYLVIWTRRLAGVGLFGYFLADSARLLGLPKAGFTVLLNGLGFAIAAMLVVFILQNRATVAGAIKRAAARWRRGRHVQVLCVRLATVWHVLAIGYVGAAYAVWALPVKGGFEYMVHATLLSVLIFAMAILSSTLVKQGIDRGFAISQDSKDRFPRLETRANRYLPVLHLAFRGVLVTLTVLALLQAWGLGTFHWMASDLGRRIIASAISIATVLAGGALVWELASGFIERYLENVDERSARARTLLPLARNALMIALVILVGLIVLSELGVNIAPLLAGAGVIGIAIGFGSQKLVQDVITGAFILFEDTVSVGDVVTLGAHSGTVEGISIRAIRLRDGQGAVHTIPFSAVGTVINSSRDFGFAAMDALVSYDEDTDRVTEVLVAIGAAMRADPEWAPQILEPLEAPTIDRMDASSVVLRCRFKTLPLKQAGVSKEFLRRMKRRFAELGIAPPVPQTKVWMANEKPPSLALAGE